MDCATPLAFLPLFRDQSLEATDSSNLDGSTITIGHEIRKLFLVGAPPPSPSLFIFRAQMHSASSHSILPVWQKNRPIKICVVSAHIFYFHLFDFYFTLKAVPSHSFQPSLRLLSPYCDIILLTSACCVSARCRTTVPSTVSTTLWANETSTRPCEQP